jgi:hypothetical protein
MGEMERWKEKGLATINPPNSMNTQDWGKWVENLNTLVQGIRDKLHGACRTIMRKHVNSTIKRRENMREIGKLGKYIDLVLNRPRKGGSLGVVTYTNSEGIEVVLTEREEVARELTLFFSKWMGKGRQRWYKNREWEHILIRQDEEGRRLRVGIADGTIITVEGVPTHLHGMIGLMKRKKTREGVEVTPEMYEGVMDEISQQEWEEYWEGKRKGTTPGASGISVEKVAYLPIEASEQVRKTCNLVLMAQVVGEEWGKEILVPIPKEVGSTDREKLRPLKMQEVLRKAILGVVMRRFLKRAIELGIPNEMQYGFMPGKDTTQPLLMLRSAIDYCSYYRKPMTMVCQDIKRAYDSVEYTTGKEMPLRRWGAP